MKNIKTVIAILAILFLCNYLVISQESAKGLLERISNNFKSSVKDYKANIKWIQGDNVQKGTIYFKNPQRIKITFSDPAGQVICSNGYELWVYISYLNISLHQELMDRDKVKKDDGSLEIVTNPLLLSPVGLDRFISDFAVEYNETKSKVSYKDADAYQLKLIRWRTLRNGMNVIYLTVQENGVIRKVEAVSGTGRKITLEIDNVELNLGLTDAVFSYQPPTNASVIEDFISSQGR